MGIDINKIVESALAKTTDTTVLEENNKDIEFVDDPNETTVIDENKDLTESEQELLESLIFMNNLAETVAFSAGLGALSLRHHLRDIKEMSNMKSGTVRKPMSMKKKIGIGVGAGLAAAGAGYAAYKNKNELGSMATNAINSIRKHFSNNEPKISSDAIRRHATMLKPKISSDAIRRHATMLKPKISSDAIRRHATMLKPKISNVASRVTNLGGR